jgi:SulP family sulfate permease
MLATVFFVVYTHNLAIGVLVGVLLSGIFFAWKIAQLFKRDAQTSALTAGTGPTRSRGSCSLPRRGLHEGVRFPAAPEKVTIDVTRAHIWDISSVAALDMAVLKFRRDRGRGGNHRHERGVGNNCRPAGHT